MDAATVLLEWQFTPHDYFEQPITVSRQDYTLVIADGTARATIPADVFDATPSMRDTLHGELQARFLAAQLLSRSLFVLSKSSLVRVRPDGRRDIFVELESGQLRVSLGSIDVRATDRDGNVVSDSRRDRIARRNSLADLAGAHSRDGLLAALLGSHKNSVRDPDNELVHQYEIRDALSAKFGGEQKTLSALGIASSEWSRLGQLCNDEPLRQGRHRGKKAPLRDATHAELEEARSIARSMIEGYLRWLDTP